MKIPKRLRHLPDAPTHGNYYICGRNKWAHGETLEEVCSTFSKHGTWAREKIMVCDVTDDFQISHFDGSIRASEVDTVFMA